MYKLVSFRLSYSEPVGTISSRTAVVRARLNILSARLDDVQVQLFGTRAEVGEAVEVGPVALRYEEAREDELAHSSIRFTLGRFSTQEEVDYAVDKIRQQVGRLRELSPLWDMYKDGVDLSSVQWAAH